MQSDIFWQDNDATDKMANNRKFPFSRKSRHIGINFFWVDNRVKQVKISVKNCPTDKKIGTFFTKPLQGRKFKLFISVIMGWNDVATLWGDSNDKDKV